MPKTMVIPCERSLLLLKVCRGGSWASLSWMCLVPIDGEALKFQVHRLSWIYSSLGLLALTLACLGLHAWRKREAARLRWERRRMELEHSLLEHRLECHADDIVLLVEPTGRILQANARAPEAYGYGMQELQALNLRYLQAHDSPGELVARFSDIQEGRTQRFETVHRRKDGSLFPVEVSVRSLLLEGVPCFQSLIRDITERKTAERKLLESERQLATLIGNLPGFVYRCAHDRHWTMEYISAGCRTITGYAPEDFIGNRNVAFGDLISADHQEWVWQGWQRALAAGEAFEDEYVITAASGETRWVWERGSGVHDKAGRLLFLEGFITDITLRKQAEMALRESQEKFSKAFHKSPIVVGISTLATGIYLDVNEEFCRLLGWERKDVIGHTAQELGIWVDPGGREMLVLRVHEKGFLHAIESDFRAKSGKVLTLLWSAELTNIQNQPCLLVSAMDVSERKAMAEALAKSERLLQQVLDTLPFPVFGKGLEGRYFLCNQAFPAFLGREEGEVLGRTAFEVLPPHLAEISRQADLRLLETGLTQRYEAMVETDDGIRHALFTKSPMRNPAGDVTGLVGAVLDISERKRAEEQILRLNEALETRVKERTDRLEAANRELEAFSYSVSHDLRAPLRVIDGFSRALVEDCQDQLGETGRHYLSRIRSGAQRMDQLIDDLLALSRINRSELDRQAVDLSGLCERVMQDLSCGDPERRIHIAIQPGLSVLADHRLLLVALENLLGNAWKFTSRREDPRIEVGETRSSAGERALFIRDNGAGFDMAHSGKLFQAFHRLHASSDFEGTGIGLAIVQRIVHRHGGRVWAEAETGKGATFFFTLPERGEA